jgi:uncharacterized alkaline shock family protein YloU
MTDADTSPFSSSTASTASTASTPGSGGSSSRLASTERTGGSTLQSEQGSTTIADGVVAKIAALAAREVDGVAELGGALAGALGSVVGRIRGGGSDAPQTAGVGVEVGQTQAAVDLSLKVLYPASIYEVANSVRQNVIDRIQGMTGLQVVEVNIAVVDLVFPGAQEPAPAPQAPPPSAPPRVQ